MVTSDELEGQVPAWCPGCGNFGILTAFKRALVDLDIEPHRIILVSGIGQAGKFPHYVKCNFFNGLHGRTLPVATGMRLANHEIPVAAFAGDGDCYGEGGNHLLHAMRRNINVKLFVCDNQVYGLTKGQASPTSMAGMTTKVQPFGALSDQLNPMALAVAMNCGLAARGFSGDPDELTGLVKEALTFKGFSLVDILQPCVSFNKLNTYEWYRRRVRPVGPEHDPADRAAAFALALEWGDVIPTGVIYRSERPTYEERVPVLSRDPLVRRPPDLSKIEASLQELM